MFPCQQGGALEHVLAGKAVAFKIAASPESRATLLKRMPWARKADPPVAQVLGPLPAV